MGQKTSCMEAAQSQLLHVPAPSFAEPWSIVWADTLANWNLRAASFGFLEHPYRCLNRDCDRDAICLKRARAVLRRSRNVIEIQRYKDSTRAVNYGSESSLRQKIGQGFILNEVVAAMKDELLLLVLYRWESLQYEAVFVLVSLQASKIQTWFESPVINMSIIESNISPDGSKVATLFYLRNRTTYRFQYDLYVFSAETGRVQDIVRCNTEVRPYVTFDPRFGWGRVAMVNYTNGQNIKDGLVLYSLEKKEVIAASDLTLSIIYAGGYFSVRYSRDGNYIILQKITENLQGAYCYADSYVFNSDTLKLLKHYDASLQPLSTRCQTNYIPLYSKCGSRICMQSEDQNGEACICVYQLPRPISLQEQCRISILQNVESCTAIHRLPLPPRLRDFLLFVPEH